MLDRARGVALAQPEQSVWRAVRSGFAASRARLGNTLALAAFSGLGFCGVTALQISCTRALPQGAMALGLLAGALGAAGRAAVTAATLLAAQEAPSLAA
jgi:hypothetical protein